MDFAKTSHQRGTLLPKVRVAVKVRVSHNLGVSPLDVFILEPMADFIRLRILVTRAESDRVSPGGPAQKWQFSKSACKNTNRLQGRASLLHFSLLKLERRASILKH